MHSRPVRVDGDLRSAFGFPGIVDGLADHEPPPVKARMLSGRDYIAFNASEQHNSVYSQIIHHHTAAGAGEGFRVRDAFAGWRGDGETQISFTTEAQSRHARAVL